VLLFVKGAVIKDRNDPDVRTMSRTGDPFELCMGPLMFTIVMCVVGLYLFGRSEGAMVMAIVGWGDGFAPVIGERYGKTRYIVRGGRYKSVEGSVACFLFSLLGMKVNQNRTRKTGEDLLENDQVFNFFLGYPYYNFGVWTLLALVGTAVEAISPSDWDNILIPLAVYHAAPFAQQASRLMML